jgi:O-antigen/teichoic acid export membrane protein
MEPFFKKILKGSSFVFLVAILAAFFAYLFRIVLARSLTPVQYGLFYAVFSFISLFLFCRDLGLNQALPKFIAEAKALRKFSELKTVLVSVFCWQFISTTVLCIALNLSAEWLGLYFFKNSNAIQMIRILSWYVFVTMFLGYMVSSFLGLKKTLLFSIPDIATNLLSLTFILILAPFGLTILLPAYIFAASYTLVTCCLVVFFVYFTINYFTKYKIKKFKEVTKRLFTFSIPVMITAIGTKVLSRANTLLLVYFATLNVVGVFNVLLPTALMLTMLGDTIGAVSFPYIAEFWAKKQITKLKYILRNAHYGVITFLIVAITLGIIFGKEAVTLFFGSAYATNMGAFNVLMFAAGFLSIANINIRTLSGIGRPEIVTKITLVCSLVMLLISFGAIPLFGIYGAAISLAIGYLLMAAWSMLESGWALNEKNK